MTVRQLISDALQLIGAYAPGQSIPSYVGASALRTFNVMIDEWATTRLNIYKSVRQVFDLVPNQGTPTNPYTLGPGGDFDTVRPVFVERASVIDTSQSQQPLELGLQLITQQEYQRIPVKLVYSTLPQAIYIVPEYPLAKVYFYPVPQVSYLDLALYTPIAVTQFDSISDEIALPPGYLSALLYNLAVRLAPQNGIRPEPHVQETAVSSLAKLKAVNDPMDVLVLDRMLWIPRRPYNWLTDSGG